MYMIGIGDFFAFFRIKPLANIELDNGLDDFLTFESKRFHPYKHPHQFELQSEKNSKLNLEHNMYIFLTFFGCVLLIFEYNFFL